MAMSSTLRLRLLLLNSPILFITYGLSPRTPNSVPSRIKALTKRTAAASLSAFFVRMISAALTI